MSHPEGITESTTNDSEPMPNNRSPALVPFNEIPRKVNDSHRLEIRMKPFPDGISKSSNKIYTVTPVEEGILTHACNIAEEGSTIFVTPGKYYEAISIEKPLRIICQGKVSIRSDGTGEVLSVNAPYVYIEGAHMKQDISRARGAITINGGAVHFHNCKMSSMAIATIQMKNNSLVKCTSCLITSLKCPAILGTNDSQIEVEKCILQKSLAILGTFRGSSIGQFLQCVFRKATKGGVISLENSQLLVDSCKVEEATVEFNSTGEINAIRGCTLEGNTEGLRTGITAGMNSIVRIINNTIRSSIVDVKDQANVKLCDNNYTNSSLIVWGTGIAAADKETFTGDCTRGAGYACGISESGSLTIRDSSFSNLNGFAIISYDNSHCSVEKCKINEVTRSSIVAYNGAVLSVEECELQGSHEPSILLNQAKQGTFSNISIKGSRGSGMEITDSKTVTLNDIKIDSCQKCGIYITTTKATIKKVEILKNSYSGIHLSNSTVTIEESNISNNRKGGIFACLSSNVEVSNTEFTRNDWVGAFVELQSEGSFTNCVFQECAISLNIAGTAKLTNSKILKQKMSQTSSAVQVQGGTLEINDTEFSGNGIGMLVADDGRAIATNTEFVDNNVDLEVTRSADCTCNKCSFKATTGTYSVHCSADAKIEMNECTVTDSSNIGIALEADGEIVNSVIKDSMRIGILCLGRCSALIKNNECSKNGECAIQCAGTSTPSLLSNKFFNHRKFGVYITSKSKPQIEENVFENNGLANIWHE